MKAKKGIRTFVHHGQNKFADADMPLGCVLNIYVDIGSVVIPIINVRQYE